MDNPVDFLLDSNWLVTLSSILVTVYVFVLGVPVLVQQTFLPEKLREIANRHDHFKKELNGLKRIGLTVIAFVLLFGNPACKYVYYTSVPKEKLPYLLIPLHLAGMLFFVLVNYRIFTFFREHVLQVPLSVLNPFKTAWYLVSGRKLPYSKPKDVVFIRLLETVKTSALAYTQAKTESEEMGPPYLVSLLSLTQVCDDNVNRTKLLSAVTHIINKMLAHQHYSGDWASSIVEDILIDDVNRNLRHYSIPNIKRLIAIAELIADRYENAESAGEDINDFDGKETEKLLTIVCGFLSENIGHQGYDAIFIRAFRALKRVCFSYYVCFTIQKSIFKQKIYDCLLLEIDAIANKATQASDTTGHSVYYLVGYIAWLYKSDSVSGQKEGRDWLTKLKAQNTLSDENVASACGFFQKQMEFETADATLLLNSL